VLADVLADRVADEVRQERARAARPDCDPGHPGLCSHGHEGVPDDAAHPGAPSRGACHFQCVSEATSLRGLDKQLHPAPRRGSLIVASSRRHLHKAQVPRDRRDTKPRQGVGGGDEGEGRGRRRGG